jgi:glucokinase
VVKLPGGGTARAPGLVGHSCEVTNLGVPVLAVDVGGTSIKAEVAAADGAVLAAGSAPTPTGAAALDAIAELGNRLIAEAGVRVERAGVVLPGIVDRIRRVGIYSSNVGWAELEFGTPLEQAWGMAVAVDHDVTCAGWAEWADGAGQHCDNLAFVAIGTGISAALVAGGRLLRGGSGMAQPGEIGHVVVRPDGPRCPCGATGCLEQVASATAIVRAYAAATGTTAGEAGGVSGAIDVELAASHDERARLIWEDAVSALADGLVVLTTLLAPERIVIGGGLSHAGAFLLDPLAKAVAERVRVQPVPDLALARYGARAGLAGAALLAVSGQTP